jgi:3-dehydroquinate synthase
MKYSRFEVNAQSRDYSVYVGQKLLNEVGEFLAGSTERAFVISDEGVPKIYSRLLIQGLEAAGIETKIIILQSGEFLKTLDSVKTLYKFLAENLASRSDTIIALGGGVIGDIAGFVASTFKRGMKLVQLPTTLLSQVDSALGGKTGVNLVEGKNLIGTFYQPNAIIVDVSTLKTLPSSEFVAGLAEVIKYGVIMDDELVQILIDRRDEIISKDLDTISGLVERSLKNKKRIVEEDETEERGRREILNFGHTIGHAIETCSNHSILHGQAVAIGMVEEARLAVRKGYLNKPALESLIQVLSLFGLPTEIPDEIDINKLNAVMRQDKKVRNGQLTIPMLVGLGRTEMMVVSNLNLTRSNGDNIQC